MPSETMCVACSERPVEIKVRQLCKRCYQRANVRGELAPLDKTICAMCHVAPKVRRSYCTPCGRIADAKFRLAHPARWRQHQRKSVVRGRYGLTLDQIDYLWESSGHKCELCSAELDKVAFNVKGTTNGCIDHCHDTGVVRGLLCRLCNVGLGSFKDSPDLLTKAIAYLKERGGK